MPLAERILAALLLSVSLCAPAADVDDDAPWGRGSARTVEYAPSKVVYDVAAGDREAFEGVLDRASFLNNIYHADPFATSIVLVLHGDEIPFFAIENYPKYQRLMTRAQSLTVGGIIEFRMCAQAAAAHGYQPKDIHGFVTLVPMAEAEIIRLQQQGYAYLQY